MLSLFKRSFISIFIFLNAFILGYVFYKIAGRALPADFFRPFIVGLLSFISIFLLLKSQFKKLAFLFYLIFTFFILAAISSYTYYQSINAFFTGDDVVAIAQSNFEEIVDFLCFYLNNKAVITNLCLYAFLSIITLFVLLNGAKLKIKRYRKLVLFLSLIFIAISIVLTSQLRPFKYYRLMVRDFKGKIEAFNDLNSTLSKKSNIVSTKDQKGELYVLVVGESLSKDSMGVYTNIIDNTPFLSKLALSDNTYVFDNAYSSFVNTVPSITASFSQGNLHTGLTFPHGENLINMAKKAGINTYWISNQVKNGNADTPIGAISSLCDYSYFTTNFVFDGSYSQKPDKILIDKLQSVINDIDKKKNNLLIVHIMGSHSPYYNRIPDNYKVYDIDSVADIGKLHKLQSSYEKLTHTYYDYYLSSIKYNDEFLHDLYTLFKDREDFKAFVYYSDHAEAVLYANKDKDEKISPLGRHNVAQFSYAMTRIPFIVNVSNSFKELYPSTVKALDDNLHKIITNDTLYDFMLDLMQVKSEAINKKLSAANSFFDMGEEREIKLLNNIKVYDDPDFMARKVARSDLVDRIYIKSANSLYKANTLLSMGFNKLHVNTIVYKDNLYVKALKDYDKDFISPDSYIKSLYKENILLIFDLDAKVKASMLSESLKKSNIKLLVHDKMQYESLYKNGFKNVIISLDDAPSLINESSLNTVDICLKDKVKSDIIKSLNDKTSNLYLMSDTLSVQSKDIFDSLKLYDDNINFIVSFYNAFNSDFE